MQDYKDKIDIIIENDTRYNVMKPTKQGYQYISLTLRKHGKKLTIHSLPFILSLHCKGIKNVNVNIKDCQRKANENAISEIMCMYWLGIFDN